MSPNDDPEIERIILDLATQRGPAASFCPSEVARAIAPTEAWRSRMTDIRRVAIRLMNEGKLDILRKGKSVPADQVRGVIRLRAVVRSEKQP
jgi:hypothetical protein